MRRVAVALLAFALACTGEERPQAGAAAPPTPQATVVIEPPQLRVGDVAVVEVAVATPPDHALRPLAPPDAAALGPLWLLDAEALPVEKQGQRWTHRTRLRVRAREIGSGTWPALALELIGPEGERTRLETAPRPFEVVSILPRFPNRLVPFPLRRPGGSAPGPSPLVAAAGGAAAALAAVAAVALLRRSRRRSAARAARAAEAAARAAGAPWQEALSELAAAARASDTDWREAADRCATALRRYATRRWGFAIECRTTEELAALAPPFALALRWPTALAWLQELDALRFRPGDAADAAARVRRLAGDAQRWVAESIPREAA
ncbi:MAG: hypothetical protein OZ948_18685 [Deltaproteobacteria bacterium]|nr:hypothetical protein [Deltaproteobacteria bacterium]